MERLRRADIGVAQDGAELLDLLGGDFNGIVHDGPNDTLVTGGGGKGSKVTVIGLALRQEIHGVQHVIVVVDDVTHFGRRMV